MTAELHEDVVFITSSQLVSDVGEVVARVGAGAGSGAGSGSMELGRRLLAAARAGNTAAVLELMAKGAPFTTDWLGTSPLHAAAAGAHADTCAVLLRAGVSRDSRTKVERTALHLAAHAGHAAVCALLLERGAAVDCRDMLQMTPLHWAAERGHAAAAAVLVAHGASPTARSKFHKTPLQLAAARGHDAIVRLLEHALTNEQAEIPAAEQQQALESIQRLQMPETKRIDKTQAQKIKIEFEDETLVEEERNPMEGADCSDAGAESTGADAGSMAAGSTDAGSTGADAGSTGADAGSAGAAALLRRHGITLLPPDSSSTVLNAIQSGRTVVLSDAGKLMLKDTPPPAPAPAGSAPAPPGSAPAPRVVLTAAPVRAAPAAGVKIFTLNNKLRARNENKIPIRRIINPHDMQIKLVPVSGEGKLSARRVSNIIKAKARRPGGGAPSAAPAPLKIIMQKANVDKILANTNDNAMETSPVQITSTVDLSKVLQVSKAGGGAGAGGADGGSGAGSGYMCVPAEFLSSSSAAYLRSQLLAAHNTIHELNHQLAALKQRLAAYETV